jgi:hypothetical protein
VSAAVKESKDEAPAAQRGDRGHARNEALRVLLQRVREKGHLTLAAGRFAEEIHVPLGTVRHWIQQWSQEGTISVRRAGPQGLIIHEGRARPAPPRRPRSEHRAAAPGSFCVWCGTKVRFQGARFCEGCGKELPKG